jgi:3-phosphoglycerate kinase
MKFNIDFLRDAKDLSGKKVLLRLDFNVPVIDGKIKGDFRLQRSLPTLEFLKKAGARTVILSHNDSKETDSLRPAFEFLKEIIDLDFVESLDLLPERFENLKPGGILLLENIRRDKGEEANDPEFAKKMATMADIYVNDAFAVSHRKHASVVGIPKFLPSFAGFLIEEEIENLSKAFNPPKPFVFILAGDKFGTKLPLVDKFLEIADHVFIGGALANDLFKTKGFEIGKSKHSEEDYGFEKLLKNPKIIIPSDVVVLNGDKKQFKDISEVLPEESILDAGPKTAEDMTEIFSKSKFILWNGTLGAYEKGFTEGTESMAQAVSKSGAESIVGGGDTITAISKLGIMDKFSFVSTGGGAMLDFLANETLPGIEALCKKD